MDIVQNSIERNFIINHEGKIYNVSYLNSDGQTLSLLNRGNWEIVDETGEELNIYAFKNMSQEEQKESRKNLKLFIQIINLCKKNFYRYNPAI